MDNNYDPFWDLLEEDEMIKTATGGYGKYLEGYDAGSMECPNSNGNEGTFCKAIALSGEHTDGCKYADEAEQAREERRQIENWEPYAP